MRKRASVLSQHSADEHFLGLDGLRAVAAFAVVLLHGAQICGAAYVPRSASLAVDFFFGLSGFVVAYAYDERLRRGMTWRRFMALRLIRLYPMLVAGTALGGLVFVLVQRQVHEVDGATSMLIAGLSFGLVPVGLAVGMVAYPVNNPVWSLFFELAASAVYATPIGRLRNHRLMMLVAVSALALIGAAAGVGRYEEIGYATPLTFLLGFVRISYPFWCGVLLFRSQWFRGGPRVPIHLVAAVLALFLLAPVELAAPLQLVAVLVVLPALVSLGANARLGAATARACTALGRLSYPLYLVHQPIFMIIKGAARAVHLDLAATPKLLLGIGLSVLVANVFLRTFDEPVRLWLKDKILTHRPRSAVASIKAVP